MDSDMGRFSPWILAPLAWLACATADAGDWPQILGPSRSGIAAKDEKLASVWRGAPKNVWERRVGSGYAGPVIQGDRLILFHRVGGDEVVECLEARTSRTVWQQKYPTTFHPQVGGGDGPLCTPTIQGDRVVTYGAQGVLSCFDLKTGKPLWSRETHKEFQAQEGYFGAGSSPLVVGSTVVVNVGGARANAGVVGFDLETGKTKWQQTAEQAGQRPPMPQVVKGDHDRQTARR